MSDSTSLPILVCALPQPAPNAARTVAYPHYIHEILQHAGLCYESVALSDLADRLPGARLLVTVGETTLQAETQRDLADWVERGGVWLSIGGACGLHKLFGVEPEPPAYQGWGGGSSTLGEAYLRPADSSLWRQWDRQPLHFFNGLPARASGGDILATILDAHRRPTERAGVVENVHGKGRCLLIAPDLTGSVVRIQQGVAVTRDGVPAPDGTAPVADGVLKSDDGGVLDWLFDRDPVPGVPALSAFLRPAADRLRELLLRAIFHLAIEQGIPLLMLWLYPRSLPAIGHLSHDTDGNDPALASRLLDVLDEAGARATWCVLPPGYPAGLIDEIRGRGHELAMHFDAMSEGTIWGEDAFEAQFRSLTELFGGEAPITNKNHYLRWEGDTELFAWCARRGLRLDQSKGASKTGEAGFNFGTCHLYYPVAPNGERIDVLELCTPTQDLEVFAPKALLTPLLESVLRHHGVLHLLFHPAHIDKPGVAEAILEAVSTAQARGLEWWNAREIDSWERSRRRVRWRADGTKGCVLEIPEALPYASLLWLAPPNARLRVNGSKRDSQAVERWGFAFRSIAIDESDGNVWHLEVIE